MGGALGWWCAVFWLTIVLWFVLLLFTDKKCLDGVEGRLGRWDPGEPAPTLDAGCKLAAVAYGTLSVLNCVACIAIVVVLIRGYR